MGASRVGKPADGRVFRVLGRAGGYRNTRHRDVRSQGTRIRALAVHAADRARREAASLRDAWQSQAVRGENRPAGFSLDARGPSMTGGATLSGQVVSEI